MYEKAVAFICLFVIFSGCVFKRAGQRVDRSPNSNVDISSIDNSQTTVQPNTILQPQLAHGIINNFPQTSKKGQESEQVFYSNQVTFLINNVGIEESNGKAIPLPLVQISTGIP